MSIYTKNNFAFTLVELIVVITILAILSTIAFISFQGYGVSSRDSVRITDIASIEKGLNIKLSASELLPIPENKINITASGTLLTYQGYAGKGTLGEIGVHGGGIDPLDGTFYTYSTNSSKSKYQLLGYLESGETIGFNQKTYADLNDRYSILRGSNLGIIINYTDNSPINLDVDVLLDSDNNFVFINGYSETKFTDENRSSFAFPFSSCKSILESGNGDTDGVYTVEYNNTQIDVYCDMTSVGGGWTLFYANNGNADSPIKRSYIQLRDDVIGQDNFLYDLSSYHEENLAGLLDYTIFSDGGANEILAANRDYFKTDDLWIRAEFNSNETLNWILGDQVLGTSYSDLGFCVPIPNNGNIKFITSGGEESSTHTHIYNGWGNTLSISSDDYPCNGYTTNVFSYAMLHAASSNLDESRTRTPAYVGGEWRADNQYRYFIR